MKANCKPWHIILGFVIHQPAQIRAPHAFVNWLATGSRQTTPPATLKLIALPGAWSGSMRATASK
ncbi:MAG: hypothetical protein DWI62_01410 [Chloroflexi bacterium]|nr:MAG: hypothetical protein DWI62_01410 [Chloroflexota bacterium]RLT50989.1 MAG: hypothetical protein DWI68_04510 [Chloroflexota bacterium]